MIGQSETCSPAAMSLTPSPTLGDDAGDLVSGHHALLGVLLALVDADVGVAEAGGRHAQEDFAAPRLRHRHIDDGDVAGAAEYAGLHASTWSCECGGRQASSSALGAALRAA